MTPSPAIPQLSSLQNNPSSASESRSGAVKASEYGRTHVKTSPLDSEVFERKHVKDIVNRLTSAIKSRGAKTPLLVLPFRSEEISPENAVQDLLSSCMSHGRPRSIEHIQQAIDSVEDAYVLMSTLKYIWCRLPGNAIIGWKPYTKFAQLEEANNFHHRAFLDYMPNCLSSGAHASIVYDFFDLIVALVINAKTNMMSARKLARMMGLWAFQPIRNAPTGEPTFERGVYEWIPASDAMFHLLLSFLRAMPQNGDIAKLPKTFQSLLKVNQYPPESISETLVGSKSVIDVPVVSLKSSRSSQNPAELIAKVSRTLKFDNPDIFKTREDFLLLKRVFKLDKEKDEGEDVISKLSKEGERILENLCLTNNGWSNSLTNTESAFDQEEDDSLTTLEINRMSIDDYFIWTWLSSLGPEQNDLKRRTFGKSYIMEVSLAEGFKKWIILEEQDVEKDKYDIELELKKEKLKKLNAEIKQKELAIKSPPKPLPKDYDIPERSKRRPISQNSPPTSSSSPQRSPPQIKPKLLAEKSSSVEQPRSDDYINRDLIRLQQQYAQGDIRLSLDNLDDDDFFQDDILGEELKKLEISERDQQEKLRRIREEEAREKAEKARIEKEVREKMEREKIEREVRERMERERIEREVRERLEREELLRQSQIKEQAEREARLRAKDLEIQRQKEIQFREKQMREQLEQERQNIIQEAEIKRQMQEQKEIEAQRQRDIQRAREVQIQKQQQQQGKQRLQSPPKQNLPPTPNETEIEMKMRELKEREHRLLLKEQELNQRQHSPTRVSPQRSQQSPQLRPQQNKSPMGPRVSPTSSGTYVTSPAHHDSRQKSISPPREFSPQTSSFYSSHSLSVSKVSQVPPQPQPQQLMSPPPQQYQYMSPPMQQQYRSPNIRQHRPGMSPQMPPPQQHQQYPMMMQSPPHQHQPMMMPMNGGYSSNVINSMPTSAKVNKKQARDAFMGNGFGI